ncbi:aspartate aminotransferase family protein [Streptomyces sp. MJP52]|uniref:pyridoxal phosphate-dependent decarboxylase family protein n=1 Tax=Streptomyces sp. MJP52 TaxID=2940555 RepID=UPI002476AAD1|nr:aspartate aminotransferase family protein [Streptomyces sp. MJP52]MDH6223551.1 L-2,4-diaminobutyrate decarboxylase [Streptomyces sp. MJP52]
MTIDGKTAQAPRVLPSPSAEARSHLFGDRTADAYRKALALGVDAVASRVTDVRGPFTGISPDALAPEIEQVDLDRPLGDSAAALAELERLYLRDAVYFHHPRYLAHLNCPVVVPALLGEAVLSAVNSSLDTWDQSAGATLIERRLIDWTAGRIGFGLDADGIFTSGGTQSNLHALVLAREEAFARAGARSSEARQALLPRLRVLASGAAHFSVRKSAKMLGLPMEAVVSVDTTADRRMDVTALRREVDRLRAEGLTVMAVVATAGTTDFGSIDPLAAVADVCEAVGAWLHVDAAYGCGLLVSPTRRHLLEGVERADSVTVDFHKSFFQPVSSSALVVRDSRMMAHATYYADYLNPARMAERRIPNQVDKSLQTTRRFDALKLWMTLRVMGADGVGVLFDEVLDLAVAAHEMLADDPRFEVVGRSQLSTVVFRYRPSEEHAHLADDANLHAREALATSGEGMVAGTRVDGRHFLKFTLLNPRTTPGDIAYVIDLLAGHAEQFVEAATAAGAARNGV